MNAPSQARRAAPTALLAWLLCFGSATSAAAQQPFLVDDAEVASRRLWHLEVSSQVDVLRPSARPVRWQNVFEWEVNYRVGARIELAALLPLAARGERQYDEPTVPP